MEAYRSIVRTPVSEPTRRLTFQIIVCTVGHQRLIRSKGPSYSLRVRTQSRWPHSRWPVLWNRFFSSALSWQEMLIWSELCRCRWDL